MLSIPDSLLRRICIASLGAFLFGISAAEPVRAQSLQEQKTLADLTSIDRATDASCLSENRSGRRENHVRDAQQP